MSFPWILPGNRSRRTGDNPRPVGHHELTYRSLLISDFRDQFVGVSGQGQHRFSVLAYWLPERPGRSPTRTGEEEGS